MSHHLRRLLLRTVQGMPWESAVRQIYSACSRGSAAISDRLTLEVMRRAVDRASVCLDAGAYRGDLLAEMLKLAPEGRVLAFEPVPINASHLRKRYPRAEVHEIALGDETGTATLHHAKGRPARSSLRRQRYPDPDEPVETLEVVTDTIDRVLERCLGREARVAFIKLDVEGAELQVLRGAKTTLVRHRPVIVFEHDSQTAGRFGTSSDELFDFLVKTCSMNVHRPVDWLDGGDSPLSRSGFSGCSRSGELYFVAD